MSIIIGTEIIAGAEAAAGASGDLIIPAIFPLNT